MSLETSELLFGGSVDSCFALNSLPAESSIDRPAPGNRNSATAPSSTPAVSIDCSAAGLRVRADRPSRTGTIDWNEIWNWLNRARPRARLGPHSREAADRLVYRSVGCFATRREISWASDDGVSGAIVRMSGIVPV